MESDTTRVRRLNPFSFPAETNIRFTLLILAVLLLAISTTGASIAGLSLIFSPNTSLRNIPGLLVTEEYSPPSNDELKNPGSGQEALLKFFREEVVVYIRILAWPIVFMVITFFIGAIAYYTHPTLLRRKGKLKPLPRDKDALLQGEVLSLADLAGISPAPIVELNKNRCLWNMQAFGLKGHYMLGMDGGVQRMLRQTPELIQAMILHELGHIANHDIGRYFFAKALRIPAFLLAGTPLIVGVVVNEIRNYVLGLSAPLSNISVFVYLYTSIEIILLVTILLSIYTDLLRVREYYADWRVVLWGKEESLSCILKSHMGTKKSKVWPPQFHPRAQDRLEALQDPSSLFRVTRELPFSVGVLIALVIVVGFVMLASLSNGLGAGIGIIVSYPREMALRLSPDSSTYKLLVHGVNSLADVGQLVLYLKMAVFFIAGYLIAGTVGVQVQREAIAEIVAGRQGCAGYLRIGIWAALIALGFEIGALIMPGSYFSPINMYLFGYLVNPLKLLLLIPWWIGFIAFTWLGLLYVRFFGKHLLGSHLGESSPKWKRRFVVLVSSGLLGISYYSLFLARNILGFQAPSLSQDLMGEFLISLTLALILFPVAFGATWILIHIARFIHPSRCPSCGKAVQPGYTVARKCEFCKHYLAPWLYATSSAKL
jgi:Zn-dependent protease with chaperone function